MLCPTCNVTISRHDPWCAQCGKYPGTTEAVTPPNPPPVVEPPRPWEERIAATTYAPSQRGYAPPQEYPSERPRMNGYTRLMIGVVLGSIGILVRGANVSFDARESAVDRVEPNAATNPRQSLSTPDSERVSAPVSIPDGFIGFRHAHEHTAVEIRTVPEPTTRVEEPYQHPAMQAPQSMQEQENRRIQQNMSARDAALRSMNTRFYGNALPAANQTNVSPTDPVSGFNSDTGSSTRTFGESSGTVSSPGNSEGSRPPLVPGTVR